MAPVVPIAIVVALALIGLGGGKKGDAPKPTPPTPTPPTPTPPTPTPPAKNPVADAGPVKLTYKDGNGVLWAISNPAKDTWVGMWIAGSPPHPLYASGVPFTAPTRSGIEQQIDERAYVVSEAMKADGAV